MTHTADLERSKRLKELGWKQSDSEFYWYQNEVWGSNDLHHKYRTWNLRDHVASPTAGEMIEWLLVEKPELVIGSDFLHFPDDDRLFPMKDGLCNALADACAWVKERKK